MKKMFFLLLLTLGWLGVNSQEVVFGALDSTGYSKIIKGAHWVDRPWAKIIHEGGPIPEGCRVDTLKIPHFGMFAFGENNFLDRNYIILPQGSLIIYKEGEPMPFLSDCANRIQSLRPVSDYLSMGPETIDNKVVLHDTLWVERPRGASENSGRTTNLYVYVNSFNTGQKDSTSTFPVPTDTQKNKKKNLGLKIAGVTIVVAGIGTGLYFLLKKKSGDPGGAPVTPATEEKGGPGGAPVTDG